MNNRKGAMTLAEGHPDFRTDVDIMFRHGKDKKDFVLRTTKDEMGRWKTKHGTGMAGFKVQDISSQKWAAEIPLYLGIFYTARRHQLKGNRYFYNRDPVYKS